MLHKVIKGLRNYSYYIAACGIIWPRSGNVHVHVRAHTRVRTECAERWKEAITSVRIRQYAPSSPFPLSPKGQECAYPPETKGRKREKAASRSEGSTPGIGSIARNSHVCARSRARLRARAAVTRVCARDPLHRVRDYARSLDQGRSLFTPTGTDVIPIYRRFPRIPVHPFRPLAA